MRIGRRQATKELGVVQTKAAKVTHQQYSNKDGAGHKRPENGERRRKAKAAIPGSEYGKIETIKIATKAELDTVKKGKTQTDWVTIVEKMWK